MSIRMFFRLFSFWAATFILPVWSLTWTPVVDVSVAGQDAVDAQVAIDADGNATAVWIRSNGSHFIVQSASKTLGGSWTSPVDLSAIGRNAATPQVTVDRAGNVIAVWQRSNGTNTIIQSASKTLGGSWTSPVDLSTAGGNATVPQVAVDLLGNATAVWQRSNIQSASKPFGGSWTSPVDISTIGQPANEPQVAVDLSGNATAVWSASNGSDFIIQSSYRPLGGNWTSPVDLSAVGEDAFQSQVAVDAAGNATAVWFRFSGAFTIIQSSFKPFGGNWTSPIDLSAIGASAEQPQIAVNASGDAVAVWRRGGNTIQSSSKPFGGNWTFPIDLATGGISLSPQVAMDGVGSAIAVWTFFNGTNFIIQAASKLAGQDWTLPAVDLSAAGGNAADPAIAINSNGEAVTTWERFNGSDAIIQSTSTSIIYPARGGMGRQVLNRLAIQSERFNKLKWIASINVVAGYRISRNGIFIAEVPSNQLTYRDHLQTKGVSVTYTVTAVNPIGVESTGITIVVQ